MKNILFVSSSLVPEASNSRRLAAELVSGWVAAHPEAKVVERQLTAASTPHLTMETLSAAGTPVEKRTAEQKLQAALADTLIEEVEAADTIVIASPMYNFTVATTLKAWLDHIARAGRTFRYTENGPIGLLKGKKIHVVTSRGGFFSSGHPNHSMDFQEPYLRTFFKFLGIEDVSFIHAEGQAISPDVAAQGVAEARNTINAVIAHAA